MECFRNLDNRGDVTPRVPGSCCFRSDRGYASGVCTIVFRFIRCAVLRNHRSGYFNLYNIQEATPDPGRTVWYIAHQREKTAEFSVSKALGPIKALGHRLDIDVTRSPRKR